MRSLSTQNPQPTTNYIVLRAMIKSLAGAMLIALGLIVGALGAVDEVEENLRLAAAKTAPKVNLGIDPSSAPLTIPEVSPSSVGTPPDTSPTHSQDASSGISSFGEPGGRLPHIGEDEVETGPFLPTDQGRRDAANFLPREPGETYLNDASLLQHDADQAAIAAAQEWFRSFERPSWDMDSSSSDDEFFQQRLNERWMLNKPVDEKMQRPMKMFALASLFFPAFLITTFTLKKTGHLPKWLGHHHLSRRLGEAGRAQKIMKTHLRQ